MPRFNSINRETVILIACVLISLVAHGWPAPPGFGESDAARLAVLAAEWHETGQMASYFYQVRTSPLYIHAIKLLLDAGCPMPLIPPILNWLNVLVGSLTLIPLYYLFRLLSDSITAAITCVFITATPAFWISNLYGMPHLPAYGLFVTALFLYATALSARSRRWLLYAPAVVLAVLAVTIKADIILCYGAFLGVAWLRGRLGRASTALALAIPVLAFAVTVAYARAILPEMAGLSGAMSKWEESFPFTIRSITDAANRSILVSTAGRALTAAAVAGVAYLTVVRTRLREVAFALVWALPPILFWGLKMGNSARHMMSSYTALMFVVGLALTTALHRPLWRWSVVGVLLVANYFGGSLSPPSRLLGLGRTIRDFGNWRHAVGNIFAEVQTERKVYAGSSTNPYVVWENLALARRFEIVSLSPMTYRLYNDHRATLFRVVEVKPGSTVGPSRDWFVWSWEEDIRALNYPEFQKIKDELVAIYDRRFPPKTRERLQ